MQNSNSLRKRIIAAMTAGVIFLTLPLSGCQDKGDEEKNSQPTSQTSSDTKLEGSVAVKSDNYEISAPLMQYFFNYLCQRFINTYGSYYFDITQDLKTQYVPTDESVSWYDYFLDYTKNYISQTMIFAEAAKAAGKELTAKDIEDINNGFVEMEEYAASQGLTMDEFIKKTYGEGITKEDVEYIQKMTILGQNYSEELSNSFTYTKDDFESYYKENKSSFDYADYRIFNFSYAAASSSDESSVTVDEEKKTKMKEFADALAECKTDEEYTNYIDKFMRENPSEVTITASSSDGTPTETDFENAVEENIENSYLTKIPYSDTTDAMIWVFTEGRKDGDTTVLDTGNAYQTILLSKAAYRDESSLRNIRHILVKTGEVTAQTTEAEAQTRTDAEAEALANKIYEEWKNGDATEDSFAELAQKYSDDGSKSVGGLYENVYVGQMVTEFNDWMFDPDRKPGDTGIVKTTFGYHVMYYVGEAGKTWEHQAELSLRQSDLSEKFNEFKEKYKIEYNDDSMQNFIILSNLEEESSAESADTSEISVADASDNSEASES